MAKSALNRHEAALAIVRQMTPQDKVELDLAYQAVVADCDLWDKEDRERQELADKQERDRQQRQIEINRKQLGVKLPTKDEKVDKPSSMVYRPHVGPKRSDPIYEPEWVKRMRNPINRPPDYRYGWQRAGLDKPSYM